VENIICVLESVLSKIFRSKEDEETAEWRGLDNDEVKDLYSPDTVQVINPRRTDRRGMQHV
jgi:hypothetical protein